MKNLSKPIKVFIVIGIFAVLFVPIDTLWGKLRPSYCRLIAPIAETLANTIEFSDTSYLITVKETDFSVQARLSIGRQRFDREGLRPTDLVTYNLSLWAALFLASAAFIDFSARWRFFLIAPLILFFWHLCDLTIFAKNAHWMLYQTIDRQYPGMIGYSYGWQWFWWWAFELNQKIIDPLLPMILWTGFCFRSFFNRPFGAMPQTAGK